MNDVFLKSIQIIKNTMSETGFLRGGLFDSYCGKYLCDCSSLVSSILKIENKELFLKISKGRDNLKSFEYFDFAKREGSYVRSIYDVRPGDILCWKKDHIPKSGDSGHMAIVISTPVMESQNLFRVRVFDSSKTPHSSDSRMNGGVGEGDLFVQINEDSTIIGVKWSLELSKVKRTDILSIRF